jgi:hypothetical protein
MAQAVFINEPFEVSGTQSPTCIKTPEVSVKYIYRYRSVLTNWAGDQQIMLSPVYANPYKMSIALLQSYRFLEQRIIADLALLRRPTPDSLLDQIKLRIAISQARQLVNRICCEPEFPGELTEGFTLIDFTPEPGSAPLRSVFMEIQVEYKPDYHKNPFALISSRRSSSTSSSLEQQPKQQHFTPIEYKFINRYLRSMPQFPGQ